MTAFGIGSDFHTEFGKVNTSLFKTQMDYFLIAGDLGVSRSTHEEALRISNKLNVPVIYICGNHEFYSSRKSNHPSMVRLIDTLREKSEKSEGRVIFLEKDEKIIGNVRILGTTLWTDYNLYPGESYFSMDTAQKQMNDFQYILYDENQLFTPNIAYQEFELSKNWLKEKISEECKMKTIVLTHHAPSEKSLGTYGSQKNMLNPSFASNLDNLVGFSDLEYWIHGHIHEACDYTLGNTKVICNPYGYKSIPKERNNGFKYDLQITIN